MTTSVTSPAGDRADREGQPHVVYERRFRASIDDVWAAVSEPARLERWIGTFTGDPTQGEIMFRMTAEGEDVPEEAYVVESCRPPHHYAIHSREGQGWQADGSGDPLVWRLVVDLAEADGVTTLTFAQTLDRPDAAEIAASVGPGWHYYLDRLTADLEGRGAASVEWGDDYDPGLAPHYRALFS